MAGRKLTGREKELETLVHRIGEILRKEGIWVLPDSIVEKEEGRIRVVMTVFPLDWIQKHGGKIPIETILTISHPKGVGIGHKLYQIPEAELENTSFVKRDKGSEK
ncbi:hypothetical protein ES703_119223 [subsurface metagenome]